MKALHWLPIALIALVAGACASIGRPEGGARDETPPVFVRSNPPAGSTGVTTRSLSFYFDENVQLEDAFNKVVISPVQIQAAQISANGRRVSVELRDTLVSDMTYTIDFGDAIKDLNEGNILDGFAVDFSTGATIDTLRISGVVLEAATLEPAQGMMVAAYANTADSAIRTLAPARIARTNQRGHFTIRNLAPGSYRIYALNDLNRDFHWDRSEDVAFYDTLITPWVENIMVTDTFYNSARGDSLITRPGRRFMPNDVLLTWFNENYKSQYLKDYGRSERHRINLVLGAPTDSLPHLSIAGGAMDGRPMEDWALSHFNAAGDSLSMWITDSTVIATDSLMLAVRYMKPDSLDRLAWTSDTLRFMYREPKKSKKEMEADTIVPPIDRLQADVRGSTLDVHRPLTLAFDQPLASIDTAGLRLEIQVDSLWQPVTDWTLTAPDIDPLLCRQIDYEWEPGATYRFCADSAAFRGIYGIHNKKLERELKVKTLEEYSNLTFVLTGADSTAIIELLSSSDAPQASERVVDGRAVFRFLNPGTYYARMYFDTNGDGKWTTGILDSIQPEEVAYYPKKLELKRNWDVEQTWNIYELPVDVQKPYAILKNRPKLKRGEQAPTDDEESEEDEFMGTGYNTGNSRNNRTNSSSNRSNNSFGGFGRQSISSGNNGSYR